MLPMCKKKKKHEEKTAADQFKQKWTEMAETTVSANINSYHINYTVKL